jgi:glutathione S-transferase
MSDGQLATNEFVTGKQVTVADITALCSIDFVKMTQESIPSQ